jgi:hypothetical protein
MTGLPARVDIRTEGERAGALDSVVLTNTVGPAGASQPYDLARFGAHRRHETGDVDVAESYARVIGAQAARDYPDATVFVLVRYYDAPVLARS